MKRRTYFVAVVSLASFCLLLRIPAQGQVVSLLIDPATNNEASTEELVNAIREVRASGLPGTINLRPNGVYTFNQPENWEYGPNALPQISGDITINGHGATIERATDAPKFRFFYVSGGLSYETNTGAGLPAGRLTLCNLTLQGGLARGGNGGDGGGGAGMGGAIFNQGSLTMSAVTLTRNTAQGGVGGTDYTNSEAGEGGGGIGGDADAYGNGGGFGGPFLGRGGSAGAFGTTNSGGGGGGGFRPYDNGLDQGALEIYTNESEEVITNGYFGSGGGLGGLGGRVGAGSGDGGDGGYDYYINGDLGGYGGGAFGFGGQGADIYLELIAGGAGGVGGGGGGGGWGDLGAGSGGFGGGGGGQYFGQQGGFGGGGGGSGGDGPGIGGFAGGTSTYNGGGGGGLGGAIFNHRGSLVMTNCILTANIAFGGDAIRPQEDPFDHYPAGSGYGGGIFNLNGSVIADCCTLSSNLSSSGTFQFFFAGGDDEGLYPIADVWMTSIDFDGVANADGGAFYNLAYGNKIEDGTASTATVLLVNTVLTNSGTGPVVIVLSTNDPDDSETYYLVVTNTFTLNDLVNNEVDGNQTNTATVVFSTNCPALIHVDLASAISVTAATFSQAALLSASSVSSGNNFQFNVVGVPGYNYVVQASTNLSDWVPVQTNVAPYVFVDTKSPTYQQRYYRAFYLP